MQKKVTFDKKIELPTIIGEITAISLDQELEFVDECNINGNLLLTGKYKQSEASRLEEEFNYKIPVDITLTKEIDMKTGNVEISDFSYSLKNGNELLCFIELLIEGEEKQIEEVLEVRECDDDPENKEVEIPKLEEKEMDENRTLFTNIEDNNETYGTFVVYLIRQDETINSIIEKYHTTVEELEKYNDLKELKVGTKLIIPLLNE
ncbi:MAG: LysM peptidoglycan-binding domain-containing protein [Bacilli bacterium]|nr:LysM peptidoglycan-binding domain-containing protein [Bacilli bacterium]